MPVRFRLVRPIAAAMVVLLALPSASFANDTRDADVRSRIEVGTTVGVQIGNHIRLGVVREVRADSVLVEYRSEAGWEQRIVSLQSTQTVIKPGIRSWWQRTRKWFALAAGVGVVVVLVILSIGSD